MAGSNRSRGNGVAKEKLGGASMSMAGRMAWRRVGDDRPVAGGGDDSSRWQGWQFLMRGRRSTDDRPDGRGEKGCRLEERQFDGNARRRQMGDKDTDRRRR
ncbi:hypothetical protein E2562_033101 [Oryza meyeriana var. granulata]|uniref:Uncharacterized protein n=1 Tax=Oryza meyeriana var. granulata TaxID=110450 RepID=A0A6G1ES03_9ORYZ|nr:hypothetical protein E2562_033101 [Oryza meyeriana var. granulata]